MYDFCDWHERDLTRSLLLVRLRGLRQTRRKLLPTSVRDESLRSAV
jgi:hypothetical protein